MARKCGLSFDPGNAKARNSKVVFRKFQSPPRPALLTARQEGVRFSPPDSRERFFSRISWKVPRLLLDFGNFRVLEIKGRKEMSFRRLLLFISPADFSEREASLLTSCKEENARNMEMNVERLSHCRRAGWARRADAQERTLGWKGTLWTCSSGSQSFHWRQSITDCKDGEKAPLPCFQRDGEIYCNEREATYRANEEDVTYGCCGRSAENSRQKYPGRMDMPRE